MASTKVVQCDSYLVWLPAVNAFVTLLDKSPFGEFSKSMTSQALQPTLLGRTPNANTNQLKGGMMKRYEESRAKSPGASIKLDPDGRLGPSFNPLQQSKNVSLNSSGH